MKHGIDISEWQGKINFQLVKTSGIDFVIIRAGYGKLLTQKDKCFEVNYQQARAAGLSLGAYWYSYANSPSAAKQEAQTCLKVIQNKQFAYPIFFDLEEPTQIKQGRQFCDQLVSSFCSQLEQAGYFAGLYMSRSPLQQVISPAVVQRYTLWIAEYASKIHYQQSYGIWQSTASGHVPGISTRVDLDQAIIDYPTIIKQAGLNGFQRTKSIDQLAREVIAGKWGNGPQRRQKLAAAGYDFQAVQARVNQLL